MPKPKFHSNYNGMLVVDKPSGMSSKDVSRFIEGLIGRVKIGHVGTLDPMAEGVLPILMGSATRLQDFLLDFPKTYEFDVTFGYETSTLDAEGEEVGRAEVGELTLAMIQSAADTLQGDIEQEPPLYSAVKYQGKALYKYARAGAGEDLPLESMRRKVSVYAIKVKTFENNVARIEVDCSRGTYVRVLARDIARELGTLGTVTRLIRVRSSGVQLADAKSLQQVKENVDDFSSLLQPLEEMNVGVPVFRSLSPGYTERLQRGQKLQVREDIFKSCLDAQDSDEEYASSGALILVSDQGTVFGIGRFEPHSSGNVVVSMKRGLL